MANSQAQQKSEQRSPEAARSTPRGRGRTYVDLIAYVERSMHDFAHVFPAVDHLSHQPPRPTTADAERIQALLSTEASADLRDAFEQVRAVASRRGSA